MAVMGRLYHLMPVMPLVVALSALGAVWILRQASWTWHPAGLLPEGKSDQRRG